MEQTSLWLFRAFPAVKIRSHTGLEVLWKWNSFCWPEGFLFQSIFMTGYPGVGGWCPSKDSSHVKVTTQAMSWETQSL